MYFSILIPPTPPPTSKSSKWIFAHTQIPFIFYRKGLGCKYWHLTILECKEFKNKSESYVC